MRAGRESQCEGFGKVFRGLKLWKPVAITGWEWGFLLGAAIQDEGGVGALPLGIVGVGEAVDEGVGELVWMSFWLLMPEQSMVMIAMQRSGHFLLGSGLLMVWRTHCS